MAEFESAASARRRFLVGALLVIASDLPCARALAGILGSLPSLPGIVSDDLETQIWLGERYLELRPEECSAKKLYSELLGRGPESCNKPIRSGELLRHIRHRRAADFRNGELVIIDGWLLTRTEARVFALAAVGFQS